MIMFYTIGNQIYDFNYKIFSFDKLILFVFNDYLNKKYQIEPIYYD